MTQEEKDRELHAKVREARLLVDEMCASNMVSEANAVELYFAKVEHLKQCYGVTLLPPDPDAENDQSKMGTAP